MSSTVEATYSSPYPALIDLEALLAPVPGEKAAGESLRYSGVYDEIREARRADERLEQGDWKREFKLADWLLVERLATDALTHRSKDLQVCAWLSEALVKLYGMLGLRDGLRALRGLHERYWDNFYPTMEEGDLEARANTLASADRWLSMALRELPLTKNNLGENYSFYQWEAAKRYDIPENLEQLSAGDAMRIQQLKELAAQEGMITGEDWRKAKNATSRDFYEEINALLHECALEFSALDGVVDEKFGSLSPGLSTLKNTLEEMRFLVERIVKEKRISHPDAVPPVSAPVETRGANQRASASVNILAQPHIAKESAMNGTTGEHIQTREMAFARLAEIADFFQATEPHSPVSYLVQRAVRWGQMPLEMWLAEVIKDGGVLGELRETLGLKRPAGEPSNEGDG